MECCLVIGNVSSRALDEANEAMDTIFFVARDYEKDLGDSLTDCDKV